jgi:hypothetical protein
VIFALVLAASPAQAALDKVAAMAGEWTAREEGSDFAATFEPAAKGTAIVQRSGYLAVFSLDGDALMLTTFVDDGFSARLKAKGKGLGDKLLVFELADVSNKAAASNGLADRMEMEWRDPDHAIQRWRWKPAKGPQVTITVDLTRKPQPR